MVLLPAMLRRVDRWCVSVGHVDLSGKRAMTVWDPPGHGLDIYHGDRLPEIMAVIPREGPERQASTGPWLPVSRCHLLRYVITRCLAAEPVLYRRRRPLTQLSKEVPGYLAIVGGGCFSEPAEQRGQDLFLLARAIMPTAGRPPSCR
jgi:hypothetical protein